MRDVIRYICALLLIIGAIATLRSTPSLASTYSVGENTYDTDALTLYSSGIYDGVTYEIYEEGFCLLTGTQTASFTWSVKPWSQQKIPTDGPQILSIYCDFTVTGSLSYLFGLCTTVKNIVLGDTFLTSSGSATSLAYAFHNCYSLEHIEGIERLDTHNVTDMSSVFNCTVKGIKITELDLSNWDTGKVTTMSCMFECSNNSHSFTSLNLSGWDTSHVTNMVAIFKGCEDLQTIQGIDGWDTSSLKKIAEGAYLSTSHSTSYATGGMFSRCYSLISLDLSSWNVSGISIFGGMFNYCRKLESVGDLSHWNMSSATDIGGMFDNCVSLTNVGDIGKWDVSNVTTVTGENLDGFTYGLFRNCQHLELPDLSNWAITDKVTRLDYMFYNCGEYNTQMLNKDIDLTSWDISSCTSMQKAFYYFKCRTLDISTWEIDDECNVTSMFGYTPYAPRYIYTPKSAPANITLLNKYYVHNPARLDSEHINIYFYNTSTNTLDIDDETQALIASYTPEVILNVPFAAATRANAQWEDITDSQLQLLISQTRSELETAINTSSRKIVPKRLMSIEPDYYLLLIQAGLDYVEGYQNKEYLHYTDTAWSSYRTAFDRFFTLDANIDPQGNNQGLSLGNNILYAYVYEVADTAREQPQTAYETLSSAKPATSQRIDYTATISFPDDVNLLYNMSNSLYEANATFRIMNIALADAKDQVIVTIRGINDEYIEDFTVDPDEYRELASHDNLPVLILSPDIASPWFQHYLNPYQDMTSSDWSDMLRDWNPAGYTIIGSNSTGDISVTLALKKYITLRSNPFTATPGHFTVRYSIAREGYPVYNRKIVITS